MTETQLMRGNVILQQIQHYKNFRNNLRLMQDAIADNARAMYLGDTRANLYLKDAPTPEFLEFVKRQLYTALNDIDAGIDEQIEDLQSEFINL